VDFIYAGVFPPFDRGAFLGTLFLKLFSLLAVPIFFSRAVAFFLVPFHSYLHPQADLSLSSSMTNSLDNQKPPYH
jgi:hypothetical protein